ncbi:MAG: tRNA (adenosine(37)-N6)-threonylcarbamoyltransferase complex ATPase subunit type 1 TsaE [Candidatus Shapirobacteria bacterium]
MKTITSHSTNETQALAIKLIQDNWQNLESKCLIFALQGELGSGKTRFVKGLGQALRIKEAIKSPTFILVHEHPYSLNSLKNKTALLYHIDAWRLDDPQEIADLQLEKMLLPGNILAIEWVNKTGNILKEIANDKNVKIIKVNFQHLSPQSRKITIT